MERLLEIVEAFPVGLYNGTVIYSRINIVPQSEPSLAKTCTGKHITIRLFLFIPRDRRD